MHVCCPVIPFCVGNVPMAVGIPGSVPGNVGNGDSY